MPLKTGLMAFWADFDENQIEAVRQWHNCQHMSERVNIPGFRLGRRYRGYDDAATFLMFYETESPSVLADKPYQAALNSPTPWTCEALKLFKSPARAVYRLVGESGVAPAEAPFFLATLRFNAGNEVDLIRSEYEKQVLPLLAERREVIRTRLWENEIGITGIRTKESEIYGGGPGRQQFVLFVETSERLQLLDPSLLPGLSDGGRVAHSDTIAEVGWLDFALR
jgi:hypothetical protein